MKLTGQRAQLVLMNPDHVKQLYAIVEKHPELWTYLSSPMHRLDDMKQHVEKAVSAYEQGTQLPFVVLDQETGHIVGSTHLYNISLVYGTTELGHTWYSPSVQRTRINTECKYLLMCHAFEELKVVRVQIKTDSRNLRAQKAIERLGAVKEGVLRNERKLHNGYVRDAIVYSIIDREWPDVKAKLEDYLSQR